MSRIKFFARGLCVTLLLVSFQPVIAQGPLRGSIIEDRAARKLVEAGDARLEADEASKAVEIWQSVIERYPTSRVRFEAHIRLGNHYLERERAYDKARVQFEEVASEENRDQDQRAEATLKMGMCFYEARNFGKCFSVMRDVIEHFPVSRQVNQAYYYIGLGHFQLGHYSRAIDALEKVGTSMGENDSQLEKVEAGKRLFVKIEDADLAALESGEPVIVQCEASSGDVERVKCFPVGRNVRIVLGSVVTALGVPQKNNGRLEVKGDDTVKVIYVDEHTADKQFNRQVIHEAKVVGDGVVSITDGAFAETLQGVVLGKAVNIQTNDPDRDLTDGSDQIEVTVEVHRAKTEDEMEQEAVALLAADSDVELDENGQPKIARYRKVDEVSVTLSEVVVKTIRPVDDVAPAGDGDASEIVGASENGNVAAQTAGGENGGSGDVQPTDDAIHSGVFRSSVPLVRAEEVVAGDAILQAMPGDLLRVNYRDEKNTSEDLILVKGEARCIEGNLGGVRVTRTEISDRELRVRTRLKTAHALTNIATRYKEFGLKRNADAKYESALVLCEEIMTEARQLGGRLLEETYVQLWKIYFEMDRLELAAAMAQRLQREFPNSGFVDDALLQLADVAVSQGNLNRAIGLYNRLVNMQTSQLRGEAQFGVAECYEKMAEASTDARAQQLYDRSFQEFKKVFDQFPDSGRVGEAVARMANYYRMDRRADARRRFDQLIGDYPESALAEDARKISEALARAGS